MGSRKIGAALLFPVILSLRLHERTHKVRRHGCATSWPASKLRPDVQLVGHLLDSLPQEGVVDLGDRAAEEDRPEVVKRHACTSTLEQLVCTNHLPVVRLLSLESNLNQNRMEELGNL